MSPVSPPAESAVRTPAIVYLDQLHWISLARASTGHPQGAPYVGVLEYLRQAVLGRKAIFPLSSTHYAELQGNANYRQRTDVAAVMSLLSGHKTISGIGPIRRAELERALHERFGRPAQPTDVKASAGAISLRWDSQPSAFD
jgi:hypothetical protein